MAKSRPTERAGIRGENPGIELIGDPEKKLIKNGNKIIVTKKTVG